MKSNTEFATQPETEAIFNLIQTGNIEAAWQDTEALIARDPENAVAHYLGGVICRLRNDVNGALTFFNKALKLKPDFKRACSDLALTLQEAERIEFAFKMYEHLIRIEQSERRDVPAKIPPLSAASARAKEEWSAKAQQYYTRGQLDKAADAFRKALSIKPDDTDMLVNFSVALWALGKHDESEQTLLKALRLSPNHAPALNQLGNSYKERRLLAKAIAAYRLAHASEPRYRQPLANLGKVYFEMQLYSESIDAYQRTLEIVPDSLEILTELAYLKQMICRWDGLPALHARIIQGIEAGAQPAEPFIVMAYAPPKLQQANAVRWSRRLYPAPAPWRKDIVLPADKRGDGKLRVGYISSDFQRHATLALITEMFAHHDRERFEIYAYSYGVDDGGPERVRLRGLVDHFCDLYNINDERACDRIRADKIDVLIDLKGFTQNHRLGLLTRRPAPVQMHYLGFPGTTGSEFVDYFIADSIAAPPGLDRYFTEKLIRLPHAYQINDRTRALPEENGPTRADYGLPEKAFVFCGFNNLYKITPEMFDVWVRLLKSVEASVLWVLETHDESTANLRREAQARGIAPERIIPAKMAPQKEHLKRYRYADLLVDTAPVCGHTTTSDALWCGVPVVTLKGDSFISSVAASLLHAVELPQLAVNTLEEYEALALSLALDPEKLAGLRRHLNEGRMRFPLFDSTATTRALEAAYIHAAWLHREGKAPEAFTLAPDFRVL